MFNKILDAKQNIFCKSISQFACIQVRGNEGYASFMRFIEGKNSFANHTALYLGLGKNIIVEASPQKAFNFGYLKDQLKPKYEVKVYENLKLTNEMIEKLKNTTYSYMAETKGYNWQGLFQFIFPFIKTNKQEKYCSEAFIKIFYDTLQWRLYPCDCQIDNVSPADIDKYMETEEAKNLGWQLTRYWNKGELYYY